MWELYYLCNFSINVILFRSNRAVKITRSSFKANVFYDSSEPLCWELENKNHQVSVRILESGFRAKDMKIQLSEEDI